jgi:metal-responsive CopG/Arc/MetJ family transcriptional regulator
LTKTVKTAISLPEERFIQLEEMARRLGLKRSQLISAALAEYLERRREDRITERLNAVYQQDAPGLDPILGKMQFSSLTPEDW